MFLKKSLKKNKLKLEKLAKKVMGLLPTRLPNGLTEFHKWADSFAEIYDLPTIDQDSIRYVLASKIIHLSETSAFKSKHYFYLILKAAAAKQVASAAFQEIKQKQLEKQKNETV